MSTERVEQGGLEACTAGEFSIDVEGDEGEGGGALSEDSFKEKEEGEAIFASAEGDADAGRVFEHMELVEGFADHAFEAFSGAFPGWRGREWRHGEEYTHWTSIMVGD